MRVLITVIYTDKLDEVRTFYDKHFVFPTVTDHPDAFGILVYPDATITFIDSASAGVAPSQNVVLRLLLPFTVLERARLISEGANCSELVVENWGSYYGQSVQYFTLTDPAGTRIQIFEDRFGEEKQLMTTGTGVGTKKVQERGFIE
ncbi:MAG: hypothetical protein ABI947_15365 [Chloroflexota bacterium]